MTIHRVGDIKVRFLISFTELDEDGVPQPVDISAATTKTIVLKDKEGALVTADATFLTDGTDGKMYYDTVEGDLAIAGTWKIAGRVKNASYDYRSGFDTFEVEESIIPEDPP